MAGPQTALFPRSRVDSKAVEQNKWGIEICKCEDVYGNSFNPQSFPNFEAIATSPAVRRRVERTGKLCLTNLEMCDSDDDELWFDDAIVDQLDEDKARERAEAKERCREEHPRDEAEIKRIGAKIFDVLSARSRRKIQREEALRLGSFTTTPASSSSSLAGSALSLLAVPPENSPITPPRLAIKRTGLSSVIAPSPTLTLRPATELGVNSKGLSPAGLAYSRHLEKPGMKPFNRPNNYMPPPPLPLRGTAPRLGDYRTEFYDNRRLPVSRTDEWWAEGDEDEGEEANRVRKKMRKEVKKPEVKEARLGAKMEGKEEAAPTFGALPPSLASPITPPRRKKRRILLARPGSVAPHERPDIQGFCAHGHPIKKETLRVNGLELVCLSL
jgi:hypothetical protein